MRTFGRLLLAFLVPLAVATLVFLGPGGSRKAPEHALRGAAPAGPALDLSGRTPSESRAVAAALAAAPADGPRLRAAEDEDAAPSPERGDLADLYAVYHPFFVRGDLNGDGRVDFAQAFVEKGAGGWFHVAVFFGRPEGGFEAPVWVERAVSLAAGDLSIDRSLLIVVPDVALDEARRWRWDGMEQRFVDADAGAGLRDDAEDTTPDDKPHVRT
jgi:hypothetical protein